MQVRGTLPNLNSGFSQGAQVRRKTNQTERALSRDTTTPTPKRRRQLTAQAPTTGKNPFANMGGLIRNALRGK